jgi:antitoxin PrlF
MPRNRSRGASVPKGERCCGPDCCGSGASCCGLPAPDCCEVDAVVSVDGRGQMVLPKEVREKFGLSADARLAVVSWKRGSEPCCLTLLKADELGEAVRRAYGPLLHEIVRPRS